MPGDFSPNDGAEAELICMFADSIRIIPCPVVVVVGAEHASSVHMLCTKRSHQCDDEAICKMSL